MRRDKRRETVEEVEETYRRQDEKRGDKTRQGRSYETG